MELDLKCRCGQLRGKVHDISPHNSSYLICYCRHCRAYVRYLGCDEILDPHGGTEIIQTTPSQLEIQSGREHLKLLRLSEKGILRWYAGCCHTPLANTASSSKVPFVGIPAVSVDANTDTLERTLGPLLGGVHKKFALSALPTQSGKKSELAIALRTVKLLFAAWLRGKHKPTPFFDLETKSPVVIAAILPEGQRASLLRRESMRSS